jgi:hypothetical protein
MLVIVLVAEVTLTIFLLGVVVIAFAITMRHGDPSATYKLYAIRDSLIDAAVFRGVERDNPWLDSLYENVNSILVHSNLLGGPDRWPFAVAVGHYQASHPNTGKKLRPLPEQSQECPEAIRTLAPDLRQALEHLVSNHMGINLQMDANEREQRRIQREKAKSLLQMMRENDHCGDIA